MGSYCFFFLLLMSPHDDGIHWEILYLWASVFLLHIMAHTRSHGFPSTAWYYLSGYTKERKKRAFGPSHLKDGALRAVRTVLVFFLFWPLRCLAGLKKGKRKRKMSAIKLFQERQEMADRMIFLFFFFFNPWKPGKVLRQFSFLSSLQLILY